MAHPKLTQKQYIKMLLLLEKKGKSGLNKVAQFLLIGAGAAAGVGVAPAVAGFLGMNAVPVLGWLGGLIGVAVVAAPPVGLVIGCGAVGSGIACGLGYLARKGGEHNEKQKMFKENIIDKICNYKSTFSQMSEEEQFKNIIHVLRMAYYDEEKISPEQGSYIIAQLGSHHITPLQALGMCEEIVKKS